MKTTESPSQLHDMSDAEIIAAYRAAEVESAELDLLAVEMERRNLDD